MTDIILLSTGYKWVGYGSRSFSSGIEELIKDAKKEIVMTVYIISDMIIVGYLKEALEKGIFVEIYIYRPDIDNISTAVDEIINMSQMYSHLTIYEIHEELLHAKVLVVDSRRVVIGSANLTFGGMVRNYELGLMIDDNEIAHKILNLLGILR